MVSTIKCPECSKQVFISKTSGDLICGECGYRLNDFDYDMILKDSYKKVASKEKWMYENPNTERWTGEEYSTREAALKAGEKDIESKLSDQHTTFAVGRVEDVAIISGDHAESLINMIQDAHYDMHDEIAEGYLENVTKEEIKLLDDWISKIIETWAKGCGYDSAYTVITDIQEHNKN